MLFYIEGNIGSGKSTFVRMLKDYIDRLNFVESGNQGTITQSVQRYNTVLVQEPVDEWMKTVDSDGKNILEKFYEDQDRWGFTFQMNSFISRAHRIQEESQHPDNIILVDSNNEASGNVEQLLLVERSIYTDRYCFARNCYQSGKMTKLEYDIYCKWNEWLSEQFKLRPQGYIYLRCDPQVNVERIRKRSREGECGIPVEYLTQLHENHDEWLRRESSTGIPILTLDVSEDFTSPEAMDALFAKVKEFVHNS